LLFSCGQRLNPLLLGKAFSPLPQVYATFVSSHNAGELNPISGKCPKGFKIKGRIFNITGLAYQALSEIQAGSRATHRAVRMPPQASIAEIIVTGARKDGFLHRRSQRSQSSDPR
jgi:hypothetical protein